MPCRAVDEYDISLMLKEASASEIADQRLVDRCTGVPVKSNSSISLASGNLAIWTCPEKVESAN